MESTPDRDPRGAQGDGRLSRRRFASVLMLAGLSTGCKCIQTSMRMTQATSELKDTSPLCEMTVVPGQDCARKVALIDVDGVLLNANQTGMSSVGENPVEMFREKLDIIASTPCYCAVVIRINSPGGGVTASDIMRRDLEAFQARTHLPTVACLMDVGAGGAYYLATACDQIVAHPTTITGGMGVIFNLYNLTGTLEQINVLNRAVRAGERIDMGSPVVDLDEETEALLQKMADQFHERYQDIVCQARGLTWARGPRAAGKQDGSDKDAPAKDGPAQQAGPTRPFQQPPPVRPVRPGSEGAAPDAPEALPDAAKPDDDADQPPDLFDGRVFTAIEALQYGLIDGVGYVDDALNVARGLGGAPQARAVILHRHKDPARTPYAITPNTPKGDILPLSLPGLERSRLPTFLYMWQPDPSLERWGGR